mgnify:FL=1
MNLNSLFEKQKQLDEYIYDKNNVTAKEVFERKIVALLVELGELANELQFFKYWKENINIDRQRAIEEYIDVIHFAIGLAVDLGIDEHKYTVTKPKDLSKLFIGITNLATVLSMSKEKEHAKLLIDNVITLGYQLGLTEEIVLSKYDKKNKINYERQNSNY